MAVLAFEDDSHFARKAEIAILRFSKKGWPLIVGGETVLCIDAYSRDFWRNLITGSIMPSCFDKDVLSTTMDILTSSVLWQRYFLPRFHLSLNPYLLDCFFKVLH